MQSNSDTLKLLESASPHYTTEIQMLLKCAISYIWKIILQDFGAWRAPLTLDLQPSFILLLEIILQVFHINCSIQQTNTGVEAPVSPRREVFTFSLKVISNFPPASLQQHIFCRSETNQSFSCAEVNIIILACKK